MNIKENNGSDNKLFGGVSMSDGNPVYKDPSELYLDGLNNTEDDEYDIEEAKKDVMTPADKRIITVLSVLNVAVFMFLGIYLALTGSGDEYAAAKAEAKFENPDGTPAQYYDGTKIFADTLSPNYSETEYPSGILPGMKALYATNKDTVGWIRIENTNVDHAVVQTSNNSDYLRATYYGDYYVGGTIFMDYRNNIKRSRDSLSKNTIVYGHYLMNQRGMFSDLDKYADVEYYKEHPVIELSTLYNSYRFKIIGAFLAAANAEDDNALFYYWYDDFSDNNTLGFANEVAFRSYFQNPSVDVQSTDKFITLETCSHALDIGGMVNARFVVIGRLIRDGESPDVDVSAARKNTQQRMPQLWYDLNGQTNPYSQYAVWDAFAN